MRIFVGARARNADKLEHFLRAFHRGLLVQMLVELQTLGDLLTDGEDWVQGRHRVLEDHRDVLAADLFHLGRRQIQNVASVHHQLVAFNDAGRRRNEPHHGKRSGRFARAGLADQADGLMVAELQVDAVERVDDAIFCFVADDEVFNIKDQIIMFVAHFVSSLNASAWDRARPEDRRRSGSAKAPSA